MNLSISDESIIIGHVARLHPMKDHPVFLKSATIIARKHPNTHFLLCGRGVSMDNRQLSQFIPKELQNRFHLLGERADVTDLMKSMDIYTSSSYSEAFPNVLGEAMASCVPCVATDVGDSASIVSDYGTVVPPRDENSLSAGIEQLIHMPEEERRVLGKAAREHIKTNFSLDKIVERYSLLYKRLNNQDCEQTQCVE